MRFGRALTKIVVGTSASVLVLQSLFAQALPVAANRPERGLLIGDTGVPTPAAVASRFPGSGAESARKLGGAGSAPAGQVNPSGNPGLDPIRAEDPGMNVASLTGLGVTTSVESAPPYATSGSTEPPAVVAPPAGSLHVGGRQADPSASAADNAVPTVRATVRTSTESASRPIPPKQGHEGPEVFAVNVRMNKLIKRYMDIYTSPSGIAWLKLVLRRAAPFRNYIASRIQHYHMPPALLYLPIVESTYNTYAVSYSGAAGLWQFMTNSVSPYGLHINEWQDDRFDFWKSTNASLEKLKYNYEQLGSWLLALAAYNVGLNYVERVVRQTGIRNVWELGAKGYLPYETMIYIPKFLAIAAVCTYAGRYGLPTSWKPTTQWTRIELHQSVDLRILARDAGIDESLLLEGNAELRYYITPPGNSGYYLKVPKRDAKVVERVLKQKKFHLMRFYIYTVQKGDALYNLSMYYGVPISMILQYNPRASARYLQIGERLVIPGLKNVPPYNPKDAANQPSPGPKITLHDPTGRFTGLYTVRPGDTLWAIAKRYGITPAELARVNGITESTIITDGTVLHVPGTGALITQGGN